MVYDLEQAGSKELLCPKLATVHSVFEKLPPFNAPAPTRDELGSHVSIISGSIDFVMGLHPEQAGYAQKWIEQLPSGWSDDNTVLFIRVYKTTPGFSTTTPHTHLDPYVSGEDIERTYLSRTVFMDQILCCQGDTQEIDGTILYEGTVGLYIPENLLKTLEVHSPWEQPIGQALREGGLRRTQITAGEQVLMNNRTLHKVPISTKAYNRIVMRARRGRASKSFPHENKVSSKTPPHLYQMDEHGKISSFPREQ